MVKNPPAKEEMAGCGFSPWVGKIPGRWKWQPTPRFLPGKFHGQRSLAACSPWGRKELDMTERLSLSFTFVNNCFEDNKRQCLMLIFISLIRWFHLILFSIFSFPVSSSLTFSLCPKCTPSLSMGRERRKYALKKAQVE